MLKPHGAAVCLRILVCVMTFNAEWLVNSRLSAFRAVFVYIILKSELRADGVAAFHPVTNQLAFYPLVLFNFNFIVTIPSPII